MNTVRGRSDRPGYVIHVTSVAAGRASFIRRLVYIIWRETKKVLTSQLVLMKISFLLSVEIMFISEPCKGKMVTTLG